MQVSHRIPRLSGGSGGQLNSTSHSSIGRSRTRLPSSLSTRHTRVPASVLSFPHQPDASLFDLKAIVSPLSPNSPSWCRWLFARPSKGFSKSATTLATGSRSLATASGQVFVKPGGVHRQFYPVLVSRLAEGDEEFADAGHTRKGPRTFPRHREPARNSCACVEPAVTTA